MNEPAIELLRFGRFIWPIGAVLMPALFWLNYRRVASSVGNDDAARSDLRAASTFLAVSLGAASALAAWIDYSAGLPVMTCLFELPPLNIWGYAIWAVQCAFLIALLAWIWIGPGARQLAALLSAQPRGRVVSPAVVRIALTAIGILVPIIFAVIELIRDARPYCRAA